MLVIKLGGSSLQNAGTLSELSALISGFRQQSHDVVVVHGGGPAINQELTEKGISWQFINGQRQTTPEMITVIEDVLANKVNSEVVRSLRAAGIPAVGVSGAHGNMLFCTQASAELMQVGQIENVDIGLIEETLNLETRPVPVIAPIGIGANEEKYNINADWAAAKIAIALKAEKLIFLTDQNGVLDGNKELVHLATPQIFEQMIKDQIVVGGMYTKVMTMMTALKAGVGQVRVLNANVASQIHQNEKIGTLLVEDFNAGLKDSAEWNRNLI